jgi:hypothetical protein
MPDTPRTRRSAADRLAALLEENRTLQAHQDADETFTARLRDLQAWQSERLLHTHGDLAARPRYAPGVDFFVRDLYAPKDFSGRDADIERAYPYMVRTLPRAVLEAAGDAARLYVLSRHLDAGMVTALFEHQEVERIDPASYAEAYRICDAFDERAEQIEIIRGLAGRIDRYVRSPIVVGILRMARGPARLAGLSELQDFLERGAGAFHHMGGARDFVATITRRERTILERIFERHPAPFSDVDAR